MTSLAAASTSFRRLWAGDADLKDKQQHGTHGKGLCSILALAWASLGVIYGDIGTSPLYVYSTIFSSGQPSHEDVLCATSLIFWSITRVVLVKYVFIVLLADDNGEGGTFALYATISRACGIPAVNAGAMPADKQLFASAAQSKAGSPSTSAKQLKLAGSQHGPECSVAAVATQTLAVHDGHDSHVHANTAGGPASQAPLQLFGAGAYLRRLFTYNRTAQKVLLGLTLLMTAMVLGDGVLTPSISVFSAVSGLQVKAGLTNNAVIGITCAILVLLFGIQSWGTQRVGVLFAPTVALWFLSNVLVGIYNISMFEGGSIFRALSPHWIGVWFQLHGTEGWLNMAGVFLCLTGCEAMFADMGHFNRQSIQLSFVFGVYPSLILTYLGQASWLMHNLDGYTAVFYNSLPKPVFWPIFVVSVLASIVASQALITGAFSMVYQCMAMGCFPRLKVHHTSEDIGGQIFIPEVNHTLLVLCVAVVAGFQSGTAIGNAYGIAVNMVMLSTVFLVSLVMLVAWGTHPLLVLLFFVPFAFIEGVFLSANILNIPHGGWFSITLAVVLSAINSLWIWGTAQKNAALQREQFQLTDLITTKPPNWHQPGFGMASQSWRLYRVCNSAPVHRNPGMALVYSETPFQVPAVFKRLVESWGVHSIVVFVTVRQVPIPHVGVHERLLLAPLEFRGFYRCVARDGYMDKVDQGELFAQSILDKIAEVMPSHAMADGALRDSHRCRPSHPDDATPSSLDGISISHFEGVKLPPSIAEEPEKLTDSPVNSHSGGKSDAALIAPQSDAFAQKCAGCEGASCACSNQQGALATEGCAPAAAPRGTSSAGSTGSGAEDVSHALSMCDGLWSEGSGHLSDGGQASGQELVKANHQLNAAAAACLGRRSECITMPGPQTHRRTTWESRRTVDGGAAVSDLAQHAVYVLHRSIIQVKPRGGKAELRVRKFLIEVVYQQLWQLTTRFWEGWKVPNSRMFEVGMVVQI